MSLCISTTLSCCFVADFLFFLSVLDKTVQLEKELSSLQSELDRIFFLLKIADPSGEAAKKRDSKVQELKPDKAEAPGAAIKKHPSMEPKKNTGLGKPTNVSTQKQITTDARVASVESNDKPEANKIVTEAPEGKPAVYTVAKPQWLGAVDNREAKEVQQLDSLKIDEFEQFVDYKDRQKMLRDGDGAQVKVDSEIENAAPGLILRKRKETTKPGANNNEAPEQSTSSSVGVELMPEDAVALLLKHERGYHAEDEEGNYESQEISQPSNKNKKPKRVLGPEKPSFLNNNTDYESWVPPEGKSSLV